ncbi:unnamed protein product [Rotaria sp. Silwood1]|nr:unnamed protein product [Rotaria sp. Silwood1]
MLSIIIHLSIVVIKPSMSVSYDEKSSSPIIINYSYSLLENSDSEGTTQFVSDQNVISQIYLDKFFFQTTT